MCGLWKKLSRVVYLFAWSSGICHKLLFMSGIGIATPLCQTYFPPAAVILLSRLTWIFQPCREPVNAAEFPPLFFSILFLWRWTVAFKLWRPLSAGSEWTGSRLYRFVSQFSVACCRPKGSRNGNNNRNGHLSTVDVVVVNSWCMCC